MSEDRTDRESQPSVRINLKKLITIIAAATAVGGILWKGFVLVDGVGQAQESIGELRSEIKELRKEYRAHEREVDQRFDKVHDAVSGKLAMTGDQIIALHDAVQRLVVIDEVRGSGSSGSSIVRAREAREGLRGLIRREPAMTSKMQRLDELGGF